VLLDLCLMARADGHNNEAARAGLGGLARQLDVLGTLVDGMLCGNLDLD